MTKATNESPTKRIVTGYQGSEYVVELRADHIAVRLKGAKRGGPGEVTITPSALHDRLLLARDKAERPVTRRVKRGFRL